MASETRTVDLKYRADIAQLKSELAKIPGVTNTEAKKMVSALDKQLKRAESAAKRTSKNTKGTFKGMEDSAGEADSVLQGLASGLDLIDPKLGAVARTAGDAAGGVEAIARAAPVGIAALGAVGVAVATLGGIYLLLKKDLDEATAKQDKAAKSAKAMADAYKTLKDGVQSIDDEIGLMTGEIDQFDIELREKLAKTAAAYQPMIKAQGDLVAEITRERDAQREATNARDHGGDSLEDAQAKLQTLNRVLSKQSGILSTLRGDYDDQRDRVDLLIDYKRGLADATDDESTATTTATAALREYVDVQSEIEAIFDHREKTREALIKIEEDATLGTLTGIDRVVEQRDQQIAQIDALLEKTGELAEAEDARAAVTAQAEAEIAKLRADAADNRASAEAAYAATQQRNHDAQLARLAVERDGMLGGVDDMLTAFTMISAGSEALFNAQKAAAISQIAINTAVAVMKGFAELGPIAGAVAAGGLIAIGGVQVAEIAAQSYEPASFHQGVAFSESSSPDELNARILKSEVGGILTQRGQQMVGGAHAIERANAGLSPGGGGGTAVVQLGHRVVDLATSRSLERGRARRLITGRDPRGAHHRRSA